MHRHLDSSVDNLHKNSITSVCVYAHDFFSSNFPWLQMVLKVLAVESMLRKKHSTRPKYCLKLRTVSQDWPWRKRSSARRWRNNDVALYPGICYMLSIAITTTNNNESDHSPSILILICHSWVQRTAQLHKSK